MSEQTKCTCDKSPFLDSACMKCLLETKQVLKVRLAGLQGERAAISEVIESLLSDLDIVQFHIDNPTCEKCGENLAHCFCKGE